MRSKIAVNEHTLNGALVDQAPHYPFLVIKLQVYSTFILLLFFAPAVVAVAGRNYWQRKCRVEFE